MSLAISNLAFSYPDEPVFRDVSLTVDDGSVLALLGPNGTGKSTLLRIVMGLLEPDNGTVSLDGEPLDDFSRAERAAAVAYVPQSETPTFAPTVFESVLLGRAPHTSWRPSRADRDRVAEVLDALEMGDIAMRSLDELSGGQRQKVRIARLLVQDPAAMLLDEPTASLDLRHRLDVLALVRQHVRRRGAVGVVAMHDIELAARFADSVALLHDGIVHASGPPIEVLTESAIETVYGVAATVTVHDGRLHVDPDRPRAEADSTTWSEPR
ncbi:ABC-type cobalamin/Fe3+-siderophores transport system, ATPase component [Halanaeroarchaeum sp. HSR-CO]|uniref:ABC transporter ATP-binding protein n=1 Tax=Halanaeroarchaeum sp. HSR-CO TaxID=2866382 RepID=UPI00217DE950|nr:ABC transporter ATP-binding protein [Halanaeroarchaeum sp. HSR-CO]UWG47163.1 ABC-type cobalamin/Fe3+-siderophores transport system, ATPase component [Halanaeroarchaeum sp. HSR-CO]